jgi:flagellar basal-body rod modification protein FlgD
MNSMPISGSTAANTSDAASPLKTVGNSVATKENFLQLLVAQIKNQNPLNPADGTQFLSQLSQFTEMEQMLGMRQDLQAIRASLTGDSSSTNQPQS